MTFATVVQGRLYSTQYVSYWPIVVKILDLYSIVEQLPASVVAVAEMQLFPLHRHIAVALVVWA